MPSATRHELPAPGRYPGLRRWVERLTLRPALLVLTPVCLLAVGLAEAHAQSTINQVGLTSRDYEQAKIVRDQQLSDLGQALTIGQKRSATASVAPAPVDVADASVIGSLGTNGGDAARSGEYITYFNNLRQLSAQRTARLNNGSAEERQQLFQRELGIALDRYKTGEYALASRELAEIIRAYAPYVRTLDDVLYYEGEAWFAQRAYGRASEAFEQLIQAYGQTGSPYVSGAVYRQLFMDYVLSQPQAVLDKWTRYQPLIRLDNEYADRAQFLVGTVYHSQGKFDEALRLFRALPQSFDQNRLVQYAIGASLAAQNDYDGAINAYNEAQKGVVWPNDPAIDSYLKNSARTQLGYLYATKGDQRQAEKYFDRVSKGHTEYEDTRLAKAWMAYDRNDYRESIRRIEKYLARYPNTRHLYEAVFLSGYIKQKTNPSNPEEALQDYYFVFNGMAANRYLNTLVANKTLIRRQQNMIDETLIANQTLSTGQLQALESLQSALRAVTSRFAITQQTLRNGALVDAQQTAALRADSAQVSQLSQTLASQGLSAVAAGADTVRQAIGRILASNQIPAFPADQELANTVSQDRMVGVARGNELEAVIRLYERSAANEIAQVDAQVAQLRALEGQTSTASQQAAAGYAIENAQLLRQKLTRFRVLLNERKFYAPPENVDRWGDLSGYGLSSLLYEEIGKSRDFTNRVSLGISRIDEALRAKESQLEEYLHRKEVTDSELAEDARIDSLQQAFRVRYVSYASAFFSEPDLPDSSMTDSTGRATPASSRSGTTNPSPRPNGQRPPNMPASTPTPAATDTTRRGQ